MARSRNYRQEYAARNARARELGFANYSQLRRSLERQEYSRTVGAYIPEYAKAGFASEQEYRDTRQDARQWSRTHSKSERSQYVSGMSAEQLSIYDKAFVDPNMRHAERMNYLHDWLVDEMEYITEDEWETLDSYKEI